MYKLQPIAVTLESENTYRVRFQTDDNGEVEYTFTMEDDPIPLLVSDNDFLEITNGDPAAARLKQSICNFHQARHFEYASEAKATVDIRSSKSDTDASKRASA